MSNAHHRPIRAVLVALSGLGFSCGGPSSSAPEDGRAVAAAFLADLHAGRVESAWKGTTVEFKSLMGLDSLRDYVRMHPVLGSPAEYVDGRTPQEGAGTLAEYTFRASAPVRSKGRSKAKAATPPAPTLIRVTTAWDEGVWKVERLALE